MKIIIILQRNLGKGFGMDMLLLYIIAQIKALAGRGSQEIIMSLPKNGISILENLCGIDHIKRKSIGQVKSIKCSIGCTAIYPKVFMQLF